MKFHETWLIPTALAIWILVTVVISFLVLKTMQKAPGEVSTDWPANIIFRDRYELPDKPSGLDRLPSSFSRSYQSLVRIDRRNEKLLRSMSRQLNTEYDAIRFYRALRKFQDQVSGSFGGLVYEMEKYYRSLNGLAPVASQEEWRSGIFRIYHPNGLALETIRYPRMNIWAKEKLEYRKYDLAQESVEFEIEVLEGSEDDFEVENMKLRMHKAMGYILHYYHAGVTEFKQRLPAPQDRERLEFEWK